MPIADSQRLVIQPLTQQISQVLGNLAQWGQFMDQMTVSKFALTQSVGGLQINNNFTTDQQLQLQMHYDNLKTQLQTLISQLP